MNDLIALFDSLTLPELGENPQTTFSGILIPSSPTCHVAKDIQGRPAVLLRSLESGIEMQPTILLENLRVEYDAHCRISQATSPATEQRFSVVHCLSDDRVLHLYFLQIMEIVIDSIADNIPARDISRAIHKLAELFQAASQPPSRSAQGLWAELFLIVSASDPLAMVEAWHMEAKERFDFSSGDQRIETKCSGTRRRRHYFSMEQAYPPPGTSVLIASLFVEPQTNGTTLGELWDRARDITAGNTELIMKIEGVCLASLGSTWHKARDRSFDSRLARESLAFYDVNKVPRVAAEQPPGISDVRFCSDLELARPVDLSGHSGIISLFGACIPSSLQLSNTSC